MNAIKKAEAWIQSHKKLLTCICVVILAALPFLHINSGVEFTDTGYSLGNYEHFADAEGTWALATFLSNVTGWLFTKLPFGHTMLGMQVYCNAILSFLLVFAFLKIKSVFPARYVFVGEIHLRRLHNRHLSSPFNCSFRWNKLTHFAHFRVWQTFMTHSII